MACLFGNDPLDMKVTTLAPWFGSNRMLAEMVGEELGKLDWCGVVFAGGMSEVPHIQARSILVNDLHRDIINLATATRENTFWLTKAAEELLFHPDELKKAQDYCKSAASLGMPDLPRALAYFVSIWMGRSANAGTDGELDGNLAVRFTASGGGSNVRYRSAIESLAAWSKVFQRCEFTVLDFRTFLDKCRDRKRHGIYVDAPFPDDGENYKHKFTEQDHRELAELLHKFMNARVVIRFYDHPLIRELYPEGGLWYWRRLAGRTQANKLAPELLITNGPLAA